MNSFRRSICVAVTAAVSIACAQAQEVSKEVKVDVRKISIAAQNTPQFQVQNLVDKRWKPKTWLEIDVDFEAKKAVVPGDKNPIVDSLEFKYFVGLNKATPDGKYVVLTATVTYVNIAEKEAQHALVFAAPAALTSILEKPTFTTADIKTVGVEVYKGGAVAGWLSTGGGRWWDKMDAFSTVDGVLLPKSKTPFATLWGDYDAEVSK